jgi:WD40 repeat protein
MAFKNDNEFVTIGLKHIKFWTFKGRNLTSQKGIFGSVTIDSLICMAFAFKNQTLFTGDSKGNLIMWTGRNATKSIKSHNGSSYCLYYNNDLLYSGGQDGIIKVFNNKLEVNKTIDMAKITSFNPGVRSLDMNSGNNLLVGLKGGDVNSF